MISKISTVYDIISNNRLLESVIERFGIDKKSHQNLEDLCIKSGANPDFVVEVIKAFSESFPFPNAELRKFPISTIIDYLRKTHQFYLEKKIPEIEQSFIFLCKDFSFTHPQLLVLANMFMDYKKELVEHIDYEEYVLFPYIGELVKAKEKSKPLSTLGLDKYSIDIFNQEHHHEEEVLTQIRASIQSRFLKSKTPLPFRIFLYQIESFEKDLLTHAKIEDEVLIPLGQMLENELK